VVQISLNSSLAAQPKIPFAKTVHGGAIAVHAQFAHPRAVRQPLDATALLMATIVNPVRRVNQLNTKLPVAIHPKTQPVKTAKSSTTIYLALPVHLRDAAHPAALDLSLMAEDVIHAQIAGLLNMLPLSAPHILTPIAKTVPTSARDALYVLHPVVNLVIAWDGLAVITGIAKAALLAHPPNSSKYPASQMRIQFARAAQYVPRVNMKGLRALQTLTRFAQTVPRMP
jgi:hypothetical protein